MEDVGQLHMCLVRPIGFSTHECNLPKVTLSLRAASQIYKYATSNCWRVTRSLQSKMLLVQHSISLILSWSPIKAKTNTKNNESCAEIDANFYLHLPKFAVGLI